MLLIAYKFLILCDGYGLHSKLFTFIQDPHHLFPTYFSSLVSHHSLTCTSYLSYTHLSVSCSQEVVLAVYFCTHFLSPNCCSFFKFQLRSHLPYITFLTLQVHLNIRLLTKNAALTNWPCVCPFLIQEAVRWKPYSYLPHKTFEHSNIVGHEQVCNLCKSLFLLYWIWQNTVPHIAKSR